MNTARDTIADLITDIRFSQRKIKDIDSELAKEKAYLESCKQQIRKVYACRHGMKVDRYGWPECLKTEPLNLDSCLPDNWLPDHKEY